MSFTNEPKMVYPQVKDCSFDMSEAGYSASITFFEPPTGTTLPGETLYALPKLGDSFPTYISDLSNSDEFTQLIATRLYLKGYAGNTITCGKFWGVDYTSSTIQLQTAENLTEDELPRSMEVTGEAVAWEPNGENFNYIWANGQAIKQPQYRYVTTFKIPVKRVIKDFPLYSALVADYMYSTNDEELFGFPEGAILFKGASMSQFKYRGADRWLVELNFEGRMVNGKLDPAAVALGEDADGWGWNWQIQKETGYWSVVAGPPGENRYYMESHLQVLFEADPLGPEEDLIEDLPVP